MPSVRMVTRNVIAVVSREVSDTAGASRPCTCAVVADSSSVDMKNWWGRHRLSLVGRLISTQRM